MVLGVEGRSSSLRGKCFVPSELPFLPNLELLVSLPPPLKYPGHRCAPSPCSISVVLGLEPKPVGILGTYDAYWATSPAGKYLSAALRPSLLTEQWLKPASATLCFPESCLKEVLVSPSPVPQ